MLVRITGYEGKTSWEVRLNYVRVKIYSSGQCSFHKVPPFIELSDMLFYCGGSIVKGESDNVG